MRVNRKFEKQGPLYLPKYEVERPGRFENYKRRFSGLPQMAISHDADSAVQNLGNVSSGSWNHTVGTGGQPIIWVFLSMSTGFNNPSISAITVGGVTPTLAGDIIAGAARQRLRAWYLTGTGGLSTGSVTISFTLSATVGSTNFWGGSVSFLGVNQSSPLDATSVTANAASGTSMSSSISTATANAWTLDCVSDSNQSGSVFSASTPQVVSFNGTSTTRIGCSYQGPIATPGSVTSTWTDSGNTAAWALIINALKPAAAQDTLTITSQYRLQ